MKRVLIITYYWPPSGGSGVQRWLKMSKYLPAHHWQPVIYTPLNPSFSERDESLLSDVLPEIEVLKQPIWEPVELVHTAFKMRGKKMPSQKDLLSHRNASLTQRLITWVRGNVLVPDGRVYWVRPSVRYLKNYLKQHPVDAIITTGPPHSMHLIGLGLNRLFPHIKWVADFRDPWSEWDVLDKLKTGERARRRIRRMEREVLANCHLAMSISPYHVERLKALGARQAQLVYNGYDQSDFETIIQPVKDSFVIRHLGYVDALRDPRPFMQAFEKFLLQTDPSQGTVRMEFYGAVDEHFRAFVNTNEKLKAHTRFYPQVPHSEAVPLMCSSTILLLVLAHTSIAEGNLPGKMFEYMASRRTILATGPATGNAALVLNETQTGRVIEPTDEAGIVQLLQQHYSQWQHGDRLQTAGAPGYSRQAMAARVAQLLSE